MEARSIYLFTINLLRLLTAQLKQTENSQREAHKKAR